MNAGRLFIAGLCIGFVAALAPACQGTREACGPDTCASGCCSAEGSCLPGTRESACGRNGAACSACGEELICKAGQCEGVDLEAGILALNATSERRAQKRSPRWHEDVTEFAPHSRHPQPGRPQPSTFLQRSPYFAGRLASLPTP